MLSHIISSSGLCRQARTFASCQIKLFSTNGAPKKTHLYDFHVKKGGQMVNFEGWMMPVKYSDQTIIESHHHTRKHVSVFDVSHMLQTKVFGSHRMELMESLTVADVQGLPSNRGTLTVFTNKNGGILDDLIVHNHGNEYLYVVSNAGCREQDSTLMKEKAADMMLLGKDIRVITQSCSLLAVQGPEAAKVIQSGLTSLDLSKLSFMDTCEAELFGAKCRITRCGYTGEDGVEVSVADSDVEQLLENLLDSKESEVRLAGLGARDSLRLEAGLCLYGNDISQKTSPVEASLVWLIAKRRRAAANFPGASVILPQLKDKSLTKRVGLVTKKGAPARNGAVVTSSTGEIVGTITSGCPSPTLGYNIAMGYVTAGNAKLGNILNVKVRKNVYEAEIVRMPFYPAKYYTAA